MSKKDICWIAAGPIALMVAVGAFAQSYPAKPLKLILPYPGGGPTDILARLLSQRLGEVLGQNVVIDNRPGGGGMIGGTIAAKSPPDGYTMFLGGITTFGIAPSVRRDMPLPIRCATSIR